MDGSEFISTAHSLGSAGDEGSLRSAVSRAYYGSFNYARHILDSLGFPTAAKRTNHGLIRRLFMNCGVSDIQKAGRKMGDLHTQRIRADYEMGHTKVGKSANVQLQLAVADDVLQKLQTCKTEPKAGQVKPGIAVQCGVERCSES